MAGNLPHRGQIPFRLRDKKLTCLSQKGIDNEQPHRWSSDRISVALNTPAQKDCNRRSAPCRHRMDDLGKQWLSEAGHHS